jgi:hypothetical protein
VSTNRLQSAAAVAIGASVGVDTDEADGADFGAAEDVLEHAALATRIIATSAADRAA